MEDDYMCKFYRRRNSVNKSPKVIIIFLSNSTACRIASLPWWIYMKRPRQVFWTETCRQMPSNWVTMVGSYEHTHMLEEDLNMNTAPKTFTILMAGIPLSSKTQKIPLWFRFGCQDDRMDGFPFCQFLSYFDAISRMSKWSTHRLLPPSFVDDSSSQ